MARRTVNAHGVRGGMRRQTPLDRFDEAVGEDESVLDRIAGIVDMPREAITAAIRDEVDREGRVAPGSFNMDPGMRAPDEFTDVTSEGYNEWAERAAERGGAKEYATSVEEEEADSEADERRKQLLFALAALITGGAGGMAANRALGPGARPGLGLGSRNPSQAEWNALKQRGPVPGPTSARVGGTGGGFTAGVPGSPSASPWRTPPSAPRFSGRTTPQMQAEIDALIAQITKTPYRVPQPDMSRLMKPRYTPQGGMAIDPVSPYLAYRAINRRRG